MSDDGRSASAVRASASGGRSDGGMSVRHLTTMLVAHCMRSKRRVRRQSKRWSGVSEEKRQTHPKVGDLVLEETPRKGEHAVADLRNLDERAVEAAGRSGRGEAGVGERGERGAEREHRAEAELDEQAGPVECKRGKRASEMPCLRACSDATHPSTRPRFQHLPTSQMPTAGAQ